MGPPHPFFKTPGCGICGPVSRWTISPASPRLGTRLQVGWAFTGRAGRISHLEIALEEGEPLASDPQRVERRARAILVAGARPVEGLDELGAQLREVAIESEIEFWELMTDEKAI